MKRILINATHNEEIRVALCKGNHLYDFDLENRTREQKKSNIYKGHVTRVEPSLEAVFVEYGSKRQGFLPVREIASNYLSGNPREENIRKLIREGDELIVQVEKEERGNKGAALSTYVSLAGRYLVLMPNNPKGGGISRQISGKLREDMKRMLSNLDLPKGMSVIVRTAGIGKTQDDLQHDLNHLLDIWNAIQEQNKKYPSPRLVHQEAGVVTRAVRDYLRDDISEIWIDNEDAFVEAETFIKAVMPKQLDKLRKYTEYEPMFSNFNVEKQIETAYQREVRLPSGGSIVIDQTEALVSIDINSAKSTKGADVAETAYHTNLEAADEIARQLRLRDMGGLIVIDFIDMSDSKHQKEVEKRLLEATRYDRARVQFGEISRFGLMEMSRQRLRPSLEESTGYICPRCHGNGMIRDLRSLSLSIMRQIEQTALRERHGEVQAEVPTDIAAFLLNEKRESLVYLEQDSGTRITILPHAHLESPNFNLHFNHQGFAPSSYERVTDTQQQESTDRGYEVDWQTAETERPELQPTRQPRTPPEIAKAADIVTPASNPQAPIAATPHAAESQRQIPSTSQAQVVSQAATQAKPAAVAWLSNLFAPTPQAQTSATVSSADAAQAIETIVNTGAPSRGMFGNVSAPATPQADMSAQKPNKASPSRKQDDDDDSDDNSDGHNKHKDRRRSKGRSRNKYDKRSDNRSESKTDGRDNGKDNRRRPKDDKGGSNAAKSHHDTKQTQTKQDEHSNKSSHDLPRREPNSKRDSRGSIERGEPKTPERQDNEAAKSQSGQASNKTNHGKSDGQPSSKASKASRSDSSSEVSAKSSDPSEVSLRINEAEPTHKEPEVVHISLDDKPNAKATKAKSEGKNDSKNSAKADVKTATTESNQDEADATVRAPSKSQPVSNANTDSNIGSDTDTSTETIQNKAQVNTAADAQADKPATTHSSDAEGNSDKSDGKPAKTTGHGEGNDDSNNASLSFDNKALFANRYVTAQKYGQASNDPRAVRAKLATSNPAKQPEQAQPATVTTKISGTVGEFIHNHLAQASMRLAKDGVITCFISALKAHHEVSGGTRPAKPKQAKTDATDGRLAQTFSFVNYGYESLAPSYLNQFARMTSAVATHNVAQGKTEVAPATIGKRAANDPRGQHPDYVMSNPQADGEQNPQPSTNATDSADEMSVSETASTSKTANESDKSAHTSKTPAQAINDLLKLNVGEFVTQVLGQDGIDIITNGQTEAAFLKALQQPLDVLVSVAQSMDGQSKDTDTDNAETVSTAPENPEPQSPSADGANQPASALTSKPAAEAVSDDSEALLQSAKHNQGDHPADTDSTAISETTTKQKTTGKSEDAHSDKADAPSQVSGKSSNKTSIETYKSMIENISEQLLQPTGLLNLTAPKVPKSRSRKSTDESDKSKSKPSDDNE